MICRMASAPIVPGYRETGAKRSDAIYPFSVGMDPIGRAAETLAALLFLRRDVAPSRSRVGVMLTPQYVFDSGAGVDHMPQEVSNLSLVTGVGLIWGENGSLDSAVSRWSTEGLMRPDRTGIRMLASDKDVDTGAGKGSRRWATRVGVLEKAGILPADNRTRRAPGVFESDTGELLLETRRRRMRVVTPRTEAVVFDRGLPIALSALTIESASGPGLLAASSLDDRPLQESGRILVVFATDALNSGMRFAEPQRKTLLELGGLPVVMRGERATLRLTHQRPEQLRLYAAALNGERTEEIPVENTAQGVRFTLDTRHLQQGPTTFFELTDGEGSVSARKNGAVS
jgi:hypothetical protein